MTNTHEEALMLCEHGGSINSDFCTRVYPACHTTVPGTGAAAGGGTAPTITADRSGSMADVYLDRGSLYLCSPYVRQHIHDDCTGDYEPNHPPVTWTHSIPAPPFRSRSWPRPYSGSMRTMRPPQVSKVADEWTEPVSPARCRHARLPCHLTSLGQTCAEHAVPGP